MTTSCDCVLPRPVRITIASHKDVRQAAKRMAMKRLASSVRFCPLGATIPSIPRQPWIPLLRQRGFVYLASRLRPAGMEHSPIFMVTNAPHSMLYTATRRIWVDARTPSTWPAHRSCRRPTYTGVAFLESGRSNFGCVGASGVEARDWHGHSGH